ncbi:hypothetical protein IW262DRAFT_1296091 [Armillaria fumosa]|nr:hypothetical protein IW262DRAFT_1296091 [Armillaria fumosa]
MFRRARKWAKWTTRLVGVEEIVLSSSVSIVAIQWTMLRNLSLVNGRSRSFADKGFLHLRFEQTFADDYSGNRESATLDGFQFELAGKMTSGFWYEYDDYVMGHVLYGRKQEKQNLPVFLTYNTTVCLIVIVKAHRSRSARACSMGLIHRVRVMILIRSAANSLAKGDCADCATGKFNLRILDSLIPFLNKCVVGSCQHGRVQHMRLGNPVWIGGLSVILVEEHRTPSHVGQSHLLVTAIRKTIGSSPWCAFIKDSVNLNGYACMNEGKIAPWSQWSVIIGQVTCPDASCKLHVSQ